MSLIPKKLKNVEVTFSEQYFPLIFKCKGRNMDDCLVWIHSDDGKTRPEIAYLEGYFHVDDIMPRVLKNINNYSETLLYNLYNMVRCRREYERTDNRNYYNGYMYFMQQAKIEWDKSKS